MTVEQLLQLLADAPESVEFTDVMTAIDSAYEFAPTEFKNGDTVNEAGQNNGSCKIFAFARLQNLSEAQTLACFGRYYRDDVLKNPGGDDHQNIRNFIRSGWDAVVFSGDALAQK